MVHTKVVELDGSVTRVFGDGSGSSGTRSFSERYLASPRSHRRSKVLDASAGVVVHVRSGTWRIHVLGFPVL